MKRFIAIALLMCFALAATGQEAVKKYDIKSGIAKMTVSLMGQTVESTTYFDDYGALQASKSKVSVPGTGEIETMTISRDGKTYTVIPAMKQIQEQPAQESINFLALTDEMIAQNKIEKVGTDTVCGKECVKYTAAVTEQGQSATSTLSIYKGFPMKTVTSVAGIEIVTEVIEFTEDAFVVASMFEVPKFD